MENKKVFKVILIIGSVFVTFCLIFIAGFWVYRAKFVATELTDDYYGGTFLDSSLSSKGMPESVAPVAEESRSSGEYDYTAEERSIIRSGEISVSVDNIDTTLYSIDVVRGKYNALLTNLNDSGKGRDRIVSLTIKVEESKFEEIYNEFKELEGEFEGSSIYESDVTDTVVDLEARLKNYKGVETQFLSILETAESIEDTLAVYKELNDVRLNIERVQGELDNIGKQTEYSYIYITLSQSSTGSEIADEEWKPAGIFRDATRALVGFAKFIGSALIWVVVFIPVIALIVVPVVLVQKKSKK